MAHAIRVCLLAWVCLVGCPFGKAEEPDPGEMARMREYLQSIPEDRMVEVFRSSLHDRHGNPELIYQQLMGRDSRGLLKNVILDLVRKRETPPNRSLIMVPGGEMPAYLAAKYFGHEPDFKAALLQLVVDTNVWAKLRYPDYGKTLLSSSYTINVVLCELATNENSGALETLLAIGQEGQLVPGSRLTLYLTLARRYNAFESERDEILRALARYLREEDGEVLSKLNDYSYFNLVQAALRKRGLIPGKLPAENKTNGGDIPAPDAAHQENTADNGEEKPVNGNPLLWPGLFLALGLAALTAAILFKFFKRTT